MGEECQWCGRRVPARRQGTGFCSGKCAELQAAADVCSAQSEKDDLAQAENDARSSLDDSSAGITND